MSNFIAEAFKRLIGLIAGVTLVVSIAAGLLALGLTNGAWRGWVALIAGPLFVILTFGSLALMIQNNQLLRRIADSQEGGGRKDRMASNPETAARREPSLRAER